MDLITPDGQQYTIGKMVAETAEYRLRLCTQVGTGRSCLLQVAISSANNGTLDRVAYILRRLATRAIEVEELYTPRRKYPDERLNYQIGFPEVLASFVHEEQGGRRINILAFACVDDVKQLVPLASIVSKDSLRVDMQTSAWILGKSLKLLAFAHDNGVEIGGLDLSKILIEPTKHYVILFDWSAARIHPDGVSTATARQEIMDLARGIVTLLGGDIATRRFPDDGEEGRETYFAHLLQLAAGSQPDAFLAHGTFYDLLRQDLGWKGFRPFTTHTR
ncbi:MAG: hypothetical protein HQ488_03965 [Parcubacteria group bacterium]|nr:hypothetical protein [Parcubacteria group bacterium]